MRCTIYVALFLFLTTIVSANDEPIDTIFYIVSADQTVTDLTPFRSALASLGYNFKKFTGGSSLEDSIGFMGDVTDDRTFNFRLLTKRPIFIEELSPILYSRYDDPILWDTVGEFNNIPSSLYLEDYLDFAMSYINGDCSTVTQIGAELDLSLIQPISASFVNFAIGNCLLFTGDADSAVLYLVKTVDLLADDEKVQPFQIMPAYVNLAWAYIQLNDLEPARSRLDELVELSQNFSSVIQAQVLETRSKLLALMFDYTSAIQDMDVVIGLFKSDVALARAYKQRGDIIMLIYEWNRALDDYNMAIELDPDYAEAYYRRGILYYTMVERENAIVDFERYIALDRGGQYVESAEKYIISIQTELDALGG